jgi:hypothetical protein
VGPKIDAALPRSGTMVPTEIEASASSPMGEVVILGPVGPRLGTEPRHDTHGCREAQARELSTFLDVGRALLAIRDGRLYRDGHDTFESYCRDRWGMERAHAYRMVQAAEVAEALSPMGDVPSSERQARELAPLLDQPDALRDAWQQANEQTGGKPQAPPGPCGGFDLLKVGS